METNDSFNGHCMNELTGSGKFLMMTQNGNLLAVSEMIQERAKIAAEIRQVELQLLSCNHPEALATLAQWCAARNKHFATELIQRAEKLEARRCELRVALQQTDEQLTQECAGLKCSITPEFVSLIPEAKPSDPVVALRHMMIDQNLGKSHLDICRMLDFRWRDGDSPERFVPDSWKENYGVKTFVGAYEHPECRNLVQKMISSRRPKDP
jgi:hypothetical protein